jgi:hypothetical protein
MRALAADTYAGKGVVEPLDQMGQALFQYPTPDGYPDEEAPWLGTLIWRWNYALALAAGETPGVRVRLQPLFMALGAGKLTIESGFSYFVGRSPSPEEVEALKNAASVTRKELAGSNTSTEFSRELVCGLILASPAYQRF